MEDKTDEGLTPDQERDIVIGALRILGLETHEIAFVKEHYPVIRAVSRVNWAVLRAAGDPRYAGRAVSKAVKTAVDRVPSKQGSGPVIKDGSKKGGPKR